jgi:hypothetical protein
MTGIETLLAIEEIKQLRFRWSRYVDEGIWAEVPDVLAPEAVLDLTATRSRALGADAPALPPIEGVQAICHFLEHMVGRVPDRLHIVTMPEIRFLSDVEAEGIWRQESNIPDREAGPGRYRMGFGTIRDTYRKIDGRWLIQTTSVSVDLVV